MRRPWATAWLLFGFMLVNFADKTVLGLCAEAVMDDLVLTRSQFGLAASSFFALFSLSALLVPLLARRVRTTVLLTVLAVLWSVAQLPMALGAGFGVLVATRLLLGAAEGPAAPLAVHHLHGWFAHRDRALPTALVLAGAAGGVALAGPVITTVTESLGWRWAFGIVAAAGLVWTVAWLLVGREPGDGGPAAEEATEQRGADVGYRSVLLSGTVISAGVGAFAAYWLLSASLTWMPDYLHEVLGISARGTGMVTMAAGLTTGVVLLVHGTIAGRRPASPGRFEGRGTAALIAVSACAVFVFASGGPVWLRVALFLGPMALANVVLTVSQTAVARVCPPERRRVVLGAVACFYGLAGVLSPLVIGKIVDAADNVAAGYRLAFLLTGALVAVAAVVVAVGLRPERDAVRLAAGSDNAQRQVAV
ncbi:MULTISPECIES: MFS transporter [Streptomyces]|uniref:MFS transporter n=1 Tax=Streptomyces TaxID=1883 RepID=UPI00278C7EED|nr:MFS transporter [Streptomyces hydrogenans]